MKRPSPTILYNYIQITGKRYAKLFPAILCQTLVLLLGLSLIMGILWQDSRRQEGRMKFRIGIAGETASEYFALGIMAMKHLDASRFEVDFEEMDEQEAEADLQSGSLDAYVLVPEGFLRSIMTGENKPVELHTTEGAADIGVLLIREVADLVYRILNYAQAACIDFYDLLEEQDLEDHYYDYVADLDMELLTATLSRDSLYRVQIVETYESMSWTGYYICAGYLILLLLFGINAAGLLANRNEELLRLLKARGLDWTGQVAAEYLCYLTLMTVTTAILMRIFYLAMTIIGILPAEWNYADAGLLLPFFLRSIPVLLMVSSLQSVLYECTPDLVSGIILQLTGAISLAYISGCIYPLSFFPKQVEAINSILPTGIARSYLCRLMAEQDGTGPMALALLAWAAVLLTITICIRRLRMEAVRGGLA